MIKRLSKARRTAILEHLLDLERQIRAEFDGKPETSKTSHFSDSDLRSMHGGTADESRVIANEFTARFMH